MLCNIINVTKYQVIHVKLQHLCADKVRKDSQKCKKTNYNTDTTTHSPAGSSSTS